MREQFFNEHVMPHVLKGGYDPHDSRQNFMNSTERPKSSFAGVAAQSAVESALAPFGVFNPEFKEQMHRETQAKMQMLARQGGHEQIASAVGSMAGQAPYWALGMGAAGMGAEALSAGPLLEKAITTAAGGIIQGAYDAASAPQGRTLIEGLKGGVQGATLTGAAEAVKPLWQLFRSGGMSEDLAKAVDELGRGMREPDATLTDAILNHEQPIDQVIANHAAANVAATKAAGVPVTSVSDPTMNGKVAITMTGADNKSYNVGPFSFAEYNYPLDQTTLQSLADRVDAHLKAGGSLEGVKGDPRVIAQLLNHVVEGTPENFDVQVPLKTVSGEPGTVQMPMQNDVARSPDESMIQRIYNDLGGNTSSIRSVLRFVQKSTRVSTQSVAQSLGLPMTQVKGILDALENEGVLGPREGAWRPVLAQPKAAMDLNALINARNSVYHATDMEGFQGILESGEIRGFQSLDDIATNLEMAHPDWSPEQVQKEAELVMGPEAKPGVSVSRAPRVASKADKAITFVIDADKMPPSRPYTEGGYQKTTYPPGTFGEYANLPLEKLGGAETFEQWLAQEGIENVRNPQFEFENRTYGEPIPLSAVRGVIVDKSALETMGPTHEQISSFMKAASADDLGRWHELNDELAEMQGEDTSVQDREVATLFGKYGIRIPSNLDTIRELAHQHNIPFRTVESGRELHSYRAGLGKQPPAMRWAMPLYDKLRELPDGRIEDQLTGAIYANMEDANAGIDYAEKAASLEYVRGDGVPLSTKGHAEANDLGENIARKGGLDELIMTNNQRSQQTGSYILAHNPLTKVGDVTDATASWGNGDLVGAEHTPEVQAWKDDLARHYPDHPIGGVDPDSGRPGESFNQVTGRILPYFKQLMDRWEQDPEQKIGVVTHFTPIRVVDGWLKAGMPEDYSVDIPTYLREHASPGAVYRLYKTEAKAAADIPPRAPGQSIITSEGKKVDVYTSKWASHDAWFDAHEGEEEHAVRVSNNAISFRRGGPDLRNIDKALELAARNARSRGLEYVDVEEWGKGLSRPTRMSVADLEANDYSFRSTPKEPLPGGWEPKAAMEVAPGWKLRKVAMNNDQQLPGGIYLIRHGETLWNRGGALGEGLPPGEGATREAPTFQGSYKETPLSHRFLGEDIPLQGQGAVGATIGAGEGQKPTIMYKGDQVTPETIFHENLHGHFDYLGVSKWLNQTFGRDGLVWDVYNGFFPAESKRVYAGRDIPEEVFNYAASAVRVGNDDLLEQMGEADTDKRTVLNWTADTSKQILDRAQEAGDSLHLRTLQRRLNSVIARATNQIDDINRVFSPSDLELHIDRGAYVVTDPVADTRTFFTDRRSAIDHMERVYSEPLNAPELVDYSSIPPTPKYATRMDAPSPRAPLTSDPLPPDLTLQPEPYKPGMFAISQLFRPFFDWLGDVSARFDRQDLYDRFADVAAAQVDHDNATAPLLATLKQTIGLDKSPMDRQSDLYTWMRAEDHNRPFVEQQLRLTPDELTRLRSFEDDFVHRLSAGDELSLLGYMRDIQPRVAAAGYNVEQVLPKGKDESIWASLLHSGRLDPRDTNLLRVSSIYLRKLMHDTFIEPALQSAEDLLEEKAANGQSVWGSLRPLLQRKVNAIRGVPDYSQRVIKGAIGATIESINNGIESVNQHLPESLQIPKIEKDPGEVLNDYIMFSYAGALALRPGVWVRDASQFFITSYPLLGNYAFTGMRKAFEAARAGTESDAFKVAERYGAFISRLGFRELMEGGEEPGVFGRLERGVQAALSVQRFAHNSNRLVAFWGHQAKVADALAEFAGTQDKDAFTRASDAWFMRPGMRQKYLNELSRVTPDSYDDFSKRMAKDLVELTQWSYRPGARPGIYDYQIGRLFGQYGTWPLNYIEYARRFLGGADKVAATQALTRLVLAHGAVLSAGQAVGVDTSHWTFTQPMAYGGGPLFQAVANIPNSFDFQTTRGDDARRDLKELVWPGIVPGGEEAHALWEAITTKDPNFWVRAMGFSPLSDKAREEGWHKLVP